MKKLDAIFLLLICLLLSCSKSGDTGSRVLCRSKILKAFNMAPYTGQTNFCSSLSLYDFEDQDYYIEDSCVKDMVPNPVDCDNVSYVVIDGKYNEARAQKFFKTAKDLGIVGVYE
jgi:hypothetical protein